MSGAPGFAVNSAIMPEPVSGTTLTIALLEADPFTPVQLRVKVVVADKGPVDSWGKELVVDFEPVHEAFAGTALAVQEDTLAEVQDNVEDPLVNTTEGFAVSVTEGVGVGVGSTSHFEVVPFHIPPLTQLAFIEACANSEPL